MLRNFVFWFNVFGMSFLVQNFGLTDQGTAFLWIHLICLFVGDSIVEKSDFSFNVKIIFERNLGILLLATWGATKLFPVEFTVAYQIMTLGQCLCINSKKDND